MAGKSISFEVEGLDELKRALQKASFVKMKKFTSFASGELHRIVMEDAFEKESDPVTGKKWDDIKSRKGRSSAPILHDKGILQDSVEEKSTALYAEVGSSMKYARIHNEGGMTGRGRKVEMPQRRFLGFSDEHVRNLLADDYVRNLLEIRA